MLTTAAAVTAENAELRIYSNPSLRHHQSPLAASLDTLAATLAPVSDIERAPPAAYLAGNFFIRFAPLKQGEIIVHFCPGGHSNYGAVQPGLS